MEQFERKYAIALGTFDGIHIAHQKVLKKVLEQDEYLTAAVTFSLPPRCYLENKDKARLLMTPSLKHKVLNRMGFDEVLFLDFSAIKDLSADEFLSLLFEEFPVGFVSVGFNYRFGKNAEGDVWKLKQFCTDNGAECFIADEVKLYGETVCSTKIRMFLENGEPEKANEMLGYNFYFTSEVIDGDKRGRDLGFPTINQIIPEALVMPRFGVYHTLVSFDGKVYNAVTNIGTRPTFAKDEILSETHIMDFEGDLYGKSVTVELKKFLREERKFNSVDELIKQISEDEKAVVG